MDRVLSSVPAPLLRWYERAARILPWREEPTAYRVWVSEVMLQQTRVEAVKPYFERFLAELPTVEALAAAPEAQLLKLWEGLGYYNRVRNLQRGAREVTARFGGRIPEKRDELLTLPGVGPYTAGAIASIAFGEAVPAVDGNVLRVVSRLTACRESVSAERVKKRVAEALAAVIPEGRAGDFNQALMELGATVCTPGASPACGDCPLAHLCLARAQGVEGELPVKDAKKPRRQDTRTVFLLSCGGRIALRRRPEEGLLAGLWELPSEKGELSPDEAARTLADWGLDAAELTPLPPARHLFTHVEWRMTAYAAACRACAKEFIWASGEELSHDYTLPSAFRAYFAEIRRRMGEGEDAPAAD